LPAKYQDEIDHPERSFANSQILMATDGLEVIGMLVLSVSGQVSEVKRLWVAPSARGAGTGAALLQMAVRLAKDLQSQTIRLTVWPWREPALRSYRRLGFVQVSSWDARSGLVCMELVLPDGPAPRMRPAWKSPRNNAGSRD
jgi:ribosomal protein S18 acetylase RimI-like enzyme